MEQVISAHCSITRKQVQVNGQIKFHDENFTTFAQFIKSLYKKEEINYPKFYKMDALSKLGFLTTELTLRQINLDLYHKDKIGVVLANAASSLDTDITYQQSISNRSNYFPSPSVFVYTLPNIMIGEICIKHKLNGETTFLISEKFNSRQLFTYVTELFQHKRAEACLIGWADLLKDHFDSLIMFIEPADKRVKPEKEGMVLPFSEETMNELYNVM